ncbi:hypothetical protein V1478_010505 [Vespula squamosa]|uniref:Transmembrane protein n=1 Tax=Vespula squamosa TaxID=30214 RepID=A0ABD2AHY4_VESSQ
MKLDFIAYKKVFNIKQVINYKRVCSIYNFWQAIFLFTVITMEKIFCILHLLYNFCISKNIKNVNNPRILKEYNLQVIFFSIYKSLRIQNSLEISFYCNKQPKYLNFQF